MNQEAEVLFARFATSGDRAALSSLFQLVGPRIHSVARKLAHDESEAEDLVQSTFVTAIEAAGKYDPSRPLMPWLFGILLNHARYARRRRRRGLPPALPELPEWADPAVFTENKELGRAILATLREMPSPYREVLHLSLLDGLKPSEIGRILDKRPATVRTQLKRGLALLRRRLPFALALALFCRPAHAARKSRFLVPCAVIAATVLVAFHLVVHADAGAAHAARPGSVAQAGHSHEAPASVSGSTRPDPARNRTTGAVAADRGRLRIEVVHADKSRAPGVGIMLLDRSMGVPPLYGVTNEQGVLVFDDINPVKTYIELDRGIDRTMLVHAGKTTVERLELPAGLRVHGTVVDSLGAPVEGAEISIREWATQPAGPFVAHTDATGRFELHGVKAGSLLAAHHRDHAPTNAVVAGGKVRLRHPGPGGAIRGRVVGPQGQPVAAALIYVGRSYLVGDVDPAEEFPVTTRVVADAEGRFLATGLAPRRTPVTVRVAGLTPWRGFVDVVAGQAAPVDVTLKNGVDLVGSVRDAAGAPLAGAVVLIADHDRFHDIWVLTQSDGSFRIGPLAPGKSEMLILGGEKGRLLTTVEIPLAGEGRWDGVVRPGDSIRGRLVDDSRQPLARMEVMLECGDTLRRTTTDDEGRFAFFDCPVALHKMSVRNREGKRLILRCQTEFYPTETTITLQVGRP